MLIFLTWIVSLGICSVEGLFYCFPCLHCKSQIFFFCSRTIEELSAVSFPHPLDPLSSLWEQPVDVPDETGAEDEAVAGEEEDVGEKQVGA